MSEIKEMVKVAKAAPHTDDDCPFCKTKEVVSNKNSSEANYNEDTTYDNDTENSSGTLAKNLKKFIGYEKPLPPSGKNKATPARVKELDVHMTVEKGEERPIHDMEMVAAKKRTWHQWIYEAGLIPILYGAHHLIPGNDSLCSSNLFEQSWLGPEDNGEHPKNIGYNVNSANNGVWLPGSYAVKGWKDDTSDDFKQAYAFLAMRETDRPFHDVHRDPYSITVKGALDELEELMDSMKNDGCPWCGEGEKGGSPPYHLNARLNAISRWLMSHLKRSPRRWKTNIATSSWCGEYKRFISNKSNQRLDNELEEMRNSHYK